MMGQGGKGEISFKKQEREEGRVNRERGDEVLRNGKCSVAEGGGGGWPLCCICCV